MGGSHGSGRSSREGVMTRDCFNCIMAAGILKLGIQNRHQCMTVGSKNRIDFTQRTNAGINAKQRLSSKMTRPGTRQVDDTRSSTEKKSMHTWSEPTWNTGDTIQPNWHWHLCHAPFSCAWSNNFVWKSTCTMLFEVCQSNPAVEERLKNRLTPNPLSKNISLTILMRCVSLQVLMGTSILFNKVQKWMRKEWGQKNVHCWSQRMHKEFWDHIKPKHKEQTRLLWGPHWSVDI